MFKNLFFILVIFVSSNLYSQQSTWNLVFQNDAEGNAVEGSLSMLRTAVRKGYPIRVGWGSQSKTDLNRSVEHVVDANFTTILGQKHVQAQIQPIFGQRPSFDEELIRFRSNFWFMIANTNGKTPMATRNLTTGEIEDETVSNRKFSWYVNAPLAELEEDIKAIF